MSSNTAFSMNELELEGAELLPARETLCTYKPHCSHGGSSVAINQTGYGNSVQSGLVNINAGNGDFNNWFSFGSGNVL